MIWDNWLRSMARPTPASCRKPQASRIASAPAILWTRLSTPAAASIRSCSREALPIVDGERKAWGDRATYTPADQMLVLNGSPRVVDGGMTTTSQTMRLNRATGDAFAEGDVKSTYSDLKAQPNGALLAVVRPDSRDLPSAMTAHSSPAVALYTGDARLWQNANVIQAPSIQFDRNHRSVVAQGTPAQPVSTVLVQTEKSGKVTPVKITSARLTYTDSERKAHFEEAVQAKGRGPDDHVEDDGCLPAAARPSDSESISYRERCRYRKDRPHRRQRSRLSSSNRVGGRPAISWFTPRPTTSSC